MCILHFYPVFLALSRFNTDLYSSHRILPRLDALLRRNSKSRAFTGAARFNPLNRTITMEIMLFRAHSSSQARPSSTDGIESVEWEPMHLNPIRFMPAYPILIPRIERAFHAKERNVSNAGGSASAIADRWTEQKF